MNNITFSQVGKQLHPEDIAHAEQLLQVTFPEPYKQFLLQYNGGIPNLVEFSIGEWGTSVLDTFLSLDEVIRVSFANRENVPEVYEEELEIIAVTVAAPVVCIGVGKNNFGKIYYFEVAVDPLLLANDLTEFLDGLHN